MATRMQQRRGTAAQWTAANPILAAGEIGFETDTSKFKMGNGSSAWAALQYFANAAELAAIVDGAPDLLNTLNELAESLGDNPNFLQALATNSKVDNLHLQTAASITSTSTGLTTALENHAARTTGVHGIADTSLLATIENVATAKSQAIANAQTKAEDAVIEAAAAADVKVAAAVAALTASSVGLGNVNNTTDLAKPVSVATEAAIDAALTEAKSDSTTKVSNHILVTTNVHGIADTEALATKVYADAAVTAHQADTTNVHGIADTSLLALKSEVAAVTKDTLGLTSVDNTADASKPVSTAQASAIATAKSEAITSAATATDTKISDHNLDTTNVHGIADTSVLVTQTDLTNAVDGATVDQSALAGVGIDYNTATDAFDLDNAYITTATQTALDLKAPLASPTFTGTVSGITKTMVGLANVDNTADTAKPVSTAQASAIATAKSEAIAEVNALLVGAPAALNTLDELAAALGDDANFASTVTTNLAAKAPLASPTFTGTVTVAAAGVAFTDGTQTKAGVPSITTIATTLAAGARTVAAGEQDKFIPLAGAVVITLPATGYSTGQSIDFYQESSTGARFESTNGVVGTPGLKFRTTNSVATAMKTSAGWLVFGDLSA